MCVSSFEDKGIQELGIKFSGIRIQNRIEVFKDLDFRILDFCCLRGTPHPLKKKDTDDPLPSNKQKGTTETIHGRTIQKEKSSHEKEKKRKKERKKERKRKVQCQLGLPSTSPPSLLILHRSSSLPSLSLRSPSISTYFNGVFLHWCRDVSWWWLSGWLICHQHGKKVNETYTT